ncbi:sulfurtransferase TusA family protein [Gluconacetobacter takamatsuzukensis]|uniref:Sulfurtransferase TusA family protein n=1 Tax=Gluconacetobacter takamatsuzukensis TaxID=1286190 RepID=A0A7W4KBW3_9PROT|nr:sulfurtransferase TusA family protein [Gluconacetobacter takamatsuzukensis]MBB2204000.1 sulfurtransferase TusA family protein [Gluconacetobacter takamatsuzukensis]
MNDLENASLDITGETCPMTFVRTRLALDRLPAGGRLRVRLRGAVPLDNVSRSVRQLGHSIAAQTDHGNEIHEILIVKAPA